MQVVCEDRGVLYTLRDQFSFKADSYWFHPKYKAGIWDGTINLLNTKNGNLYAGLIPYVEKFADAYDCELIIDEKLKQKTELSKESFVDFIKNLNIHILDKDGNSSKMRDYQLFAAYTAIKNKRRTLLSATASGKTLIMYSLAKWYEQNTKKKILIVVPRLGLVTQAVKDFDNYSKNIEWDAEENMHIIHEGKELNSDKRIYVSTWQSIYKQRRTYFDQFDAVIIDECHEAKANSLTGILEKMPNCEYRIGMTGTFDDIKANESVIEGLLGCRTQVSRAKELMDRGDIAQININVLTLRYSEEESKLVKKAFSDYKDEVDYITKHKRRNEFIVNLALSFNKNSIVLFNKIEHGKALAELANSKTDRPVYLIYGDVSVEERDEIKRSLEIENDAVAFVSYGTFSTGISVNNIHHAIFAASYKAKIRILQSCGRILRLHKDKDVAQLYDIVDDFSYKKHVNYMMKHFMIRFKFYVKEKFNYKLHKINI